MILDKEMETTLREKWPRTKRKALEQKWSFTEMTIHMAKENSAFIGFAPNYRYASHVAHADETGILMIKEREQRSSNQRDIANMAHFFFCASIGLNVYLITKTNATFFNELVKSISNISEIGNKYLPLLQEDELYDKFR